MDIFLQQIINGLVLGSVYALVALGYTMVYGIIQLINFAHGEVLMFGALTAWTVAGIMQPAFPDLPGWVVLIVAATVACTVAAAGTAWPDPGCGEATRVAVTAWRGAAGGGVATPRLCAGRETTGVP